MVPHLVGAQSAYKDMDMLISSHTHTTLQIHAVLVMGWYNEKKMTDQYAEEKRWVFSFDLKDNVCESVMCKLGRWGNIRITIL